MSIEKPYVPSEAEMEKDEEMAAEVQLDLEQEKRYEKLNQEFNNQVDNLIKKGLPSLAGIDKEEFARIFKPLKEKLKELALREFPENHIPFIIVPREKLLPLEKKFSCVTIDGKKTRSDINSYDLSILRGSTDPQTLAYLIVDVETGKEKMIDRILPTQDINDMVSKLKREGRSPLTAEEGVALVLQYPEVLKDHSIDLAGTIYSGPTKMEVVAFLDIDDYFGGTPYLGKYEIRSRDHVKRSNGGVASCNSRVE